MAGGGSIRGSLPSRAKRARERGEAEEEDDKGKLVRSGSEEEEEHEDGRRGTARGEGGEERSGETSNATVEAFRRVPSLSLWLFVVGRRPTTSSDVVGLLLERGVRGEGRVLSFREDRFSREGWCAWWSSCSLLPSSSVLVSW